MHCVSLCTPSFPLGLLPASGHDQTPRSCKDHTCATTSNCHHPHLPHLLSHIGHDRRSALCLRYTPIVSVAYCSPLYCLCVLWFTHLIPPALCLKCNISPPVLKTAHLILVRTLIRTSRSRRFRLTLPRSTSEQSSSLIFLIFLFLCLPLETTLLTRTKPFSRESMRRPQDCDTRLGGWSHRVHHGFS